MEEPTEKPVETPVETQVETQVGAPAGSASADAHGAQAQEQERQMAAKEEARRDAEWQARPAAAEVAFGPDASETAAATRIQTHARRRAHSVHVQQIGRGKVQGLLEEAEREQPDGDAQASSPTKAELAADLRAAALEAEAAASSLRAELAKVQDVLLVARKATIESKRHAEVALRARQLQAEAEGKAEAEARARGEAMARAQAEATAHADTKARLEAVERAQAVHLQAQEWSIFAPPTPVTFSSTTTTIVTRTSHERYALPVASPMRPADCATFAQRNQVDAGGEASRGLEDPFLAKLRNAEAHDAAAAAAAKAVGLSFKAVSESSPSPSRGMDASSRDARALLRHRRRECRDGGCGLCGVNVFAAPIPPSPAINSSPGPSSSSTSKSQGQWRVSPGWPKKEEEEKEEEWRRPKSASRRRSA